MILLFMNELKKSVWESKKYLGMTSTEWEIKINSKHSKDMSNKYWENIRLI